MRTHDLYDTGVMLSNWATVGSRSGASWICTRYMKRVLRWCAYDINQIYKLQLKNRSESDVSSCEVTSAVAKKAQAKNMRFQFFYSLSSVHGHTSIMEIMGSNPLEASDFFWAFFASAW